DTQRVDTTSTGVRASVGSLAYAERRYVRVTVGPPTAPPDCTTIDPQLGEVRRSEPCPANNAALESAFTPAHTRALAIMDGAIARMSGTDTTRDAAIARRFGPVSHSRLLTRLSMLRTTVAAVSSSHECGNACNSTCNAGSYAYSCGPTSCDPNSNTGPLIVICERLRGSDQEMVASAIIHESAHATSGLLQAAAAPNRRGPADWAYRWERMAATITEMTPNRSLDNADSYTQFVMDLRDPMFTPVGSKPIEDAPVDNFQGTWTSTERTAVRHGLANCQKWLIWGTQYVANAYGAAVEGIADTTYIRAAVRFGGFVTPPGDADRARLAAIQSRYNTLAARMRQPIRIEHAAAGAATTFSASAPLFLWVGNDLLRAGNADARGHMLLRKIAEAAPEIDAGQRTAYAELAWDIHSQYALDHP
ncbi:MAG: hypothetical protein WCF57_12310, partial [Pyrinomonadaceae bacterium]